MKVVYKRSTYKEATEQAVTQQENPGHKRVRNVVQISTLKGGK